MKWIAVILIMFSSTMICPTADAAKHPTCEDGLTSASLTSLVQYLKKADPKSHKSISFRGFSHTFDQNDFETFQEQLNQKYKLRAMLDDVDKSAPLLIIQFRLSGRAENLLPVIEAFVEHQDKLFWLKE